MKRVALILLALGMNVQAALTLNDARAQGRVETLSGYLPRFNRMRNAGAGQSYQRGAHGEKATRSWPTAIICRSMKWRKWPVKNWLPARSRANT
jgi:hypothetical protein